MKYRNYYCYPKYSDGDKTYYGSIEGLPEVPVVEAANLDDFERLFHQAVDDQVDKGKSKKTRKRVGWVIFLISFFLLLVAAIVTCPDKQAHKEAIQSVINERIKEEFGANTEDDELALLGLSLGSSISGWVLDGALTVENHFVFSEGKFKSENGARRVSFGFLGHVFTFKKEDLDKFIEDNI